MSVNENGLQEVVESIGVLADRAESDKWALAEAIEVAYAEFPAYHHGLTSGLCQRLRKSSDQVYNLRYASALKSKLLVVSVLSVSHFSTLSHLRDKYDLTDEDCKEWIGWAEENGISVREMSIEISTRHTQDAKKAYFRLVLRVQRDVERLWEGAEAIGMPEALWAATRAALKVLKDWIAALLEWGKLGVNKP
jgi:hypothetical protein